MVIIDAKKRGDSSRVTFDGIWNPNLESIGKCGW